MDWLLSHIVNENKALHLNDGGYPRMGAPPLVELAVTLPERQSYLNNYLYPYCSLE